MSYTSSSSETKPSLRGTELLAAGLGALKANDPVTAEDFFRSVLRQSPDDVSALHGLGKALHDQARLDEAIAVFEQAASRGADAPRARYHLGLLRLLLGDYAAGWQGWEERRSVLNFPRLPIPLWNGNPMPGRRLLLLGEQGFGDVIQFVRFLPDAVQRSGAQVTFGCAPPLLPLLDPFCVEHGISALTGKINPAAFDAYAWVGSLPSLLGAASGCARAYLIADTGSIAVWRRRRPRQMRCIGLCWEGRATHPQDTQRSMAPELLRPLFEHADITLVGLQVPPITRPAPAQSLGMDWGPDITDFGTAAAMIAALDLLVTVDTAMAHLAGALGVPALVLLPHVPDWRWGISGEKSIWYASLRLFRQQHPGDWSAPVAAVTAALAA
ncbi:MAG: tetratricopeptide repeat protein [Alphaproteobacteria bacterium]